MYNVFTAPDYTRRLPKRRLIEYTLRDLGLHPDDLEYQEIYARVLEASDILTKKEIVNLIEELYG